MPLIATRGAASVQGFGEFAQTTAPVYIEDVFSTWLYTGTGATQTITNNIDLSTKGGLVWIKNRSTPTNTGDHRLYDTLRGINNALFSNTTDASTTLNDSLTTFGISGFTLGTNPKVNESAVTWASWTFREQPKFFDIVTYTGNGSNRTISHNLGSVPGCIIVRQYSSGGDWIVYHRSLGNTDYVRLNTTGATAALSTVWNNTTPTSTEFTVGTSNAVNANGASFIAYLFAHDAGGFGLSGSDNVISCGSFTKSTATTTVTLGYEPQWVLFKRTNSTGDWILFDTMRGLTVTQADRGLYPNLSIAEDNSAGMIPTATGFDVTNYWGQSNETYIYIAIRRGPMKTPTSGTSVFAPYVTSSISNVGSSSNPLYNFGFLTDTIIQRNKAGTDGWYMGSRLQGTNYLKTETTAAEASSSGLVWDSNVAAIAFSSANYGTYGFKRAPGFFDVVCYTRTSTQMTLNHNLGVMPELIIKKNRSRAGTYWDVMPNVSPYDYRYDIYLNDTQAISGPSTIYWGSAPTSTTFGVDMSVDGSSPNDTFVCYLFATVSGVSKVGSYTGTGALQTVNCGFTTGARFVLIKRTDSTGDWWVYDSARGISSGNDPYLFMNSTAAEVTNTNYVDTTSVGFQVTAAAPAGLNANGGTYIFLAIA